ncbi:MAG: YHS domain-containing protein [Phycisphaerales bacterium]|nr:MAG: YHS domain-containing protein [Phycisphaerales bacterium]
MDAKKKGLMTVLLVVGFTFVGLTMLNGCGKEEPAAEPNDANTAMTTETGKEIAGTEQTTCPVMEGNKINEKYFVEYQGKKVYFCCPGCDDKFLADPEKYLAKLPQFN